jgi:hypothetical protein
LIRAFKATTASVHDSQVDLSKRSSTGRGYSGVAAKGYSTTMQRGTRAGPISLRKVKERADIKEAGTDREGICGAQEVLQGRARYGHDLT